MAKSAKAPRKIGVLRGMETTFPDALVPFINTTYAESHNVVADFIKLDAISMDDKRDYDVIIDRISHEVPFYRSFLKSAALKGTYIINNPFWWSADDKFIDNIIAQQVKVAVPKSMILPHHDLPTNTQDSSYRNLNFPLNWEKVFDYIGFPCYLKPHDGGGWRGVSKCHNQEEFFKAYNESGQDCMLLQENIDFTEYYRCYGIGREKVHIMKYNPLAPHHLRYKDVPEAPIAPKMLKRLQKDVLALCSALGYDMNTVEFAVRDGIPYAIDFMNPAPDADYHSVGHDNFVWIVEAVASFAVKKALEPKKAMTFNPPTALAK